MSFIEHDSALWPIVVIVASGQFSLKQHTESLKKWNKWLARKETFYVIRVFLDNKAIEHTPDIGESTVNWLQNGATKKIKEHVGAMLLVLPEAQYDDSKAINKIFGVSGGMFPSVAAAHCYLQSMPNSNDEILTNKGTPLETATTEDLESIVTKSIAKHMRSKKTVRH